MPSPSSLFVRSAAITDIGRVRRQNEDRFLRRDELGLYAVADGIGGLPGGAAAAHTAIDVLLRHATADRVPATPDILTEWLLAANAAVIDIGQRLSPIHGIGTTLTCGLVTGNRLWLAHIGDSRCYRFSADRTVRCLTEDHSVENDHRRRTARGETGLVVPDPRLNGALTRCIGQLNTPEIDVAAFTLAPGDFVLFATDGITGAMTEYELAEIIARSASVEASLDAMVDLANARGGRDNATAVLLEFATFPSS